MKRAALLVAASAFVYFGLHARAADDSTESGVFALFKFEQEIGADLLNAALERGFIMNSPLPNAVRLMPPLVLTEAEADEAVALLDASIEAVVA